jgi:hypothetical protein
MGANAGRTCRFWTDSWLEEGCVLSNEVDITVWEGEEQMKVTDFVIDGGELGLEQAPSTSRPPQISNRSNQATSNK